jgi:putative PIN family toxin of toxin-antitoxin system
MTRVTVDTNVLISALLFHGLPGEFLGLALDAASDGSIRLITSPVLLDELDEKLRFKFHWSPAKADQIRKELEALCDVVSTIGSLTVIEEDPDDDRVLECAVAGRADCIVSGDRHLLKLSAYEGMPIVTVRQFMDRIKT